LKHSRYCHFCSLLIACNFQLGRGIKVIVSKTTDLSSQVFAFRLGFTSKLSKISIGRGCKMKSSGGNTTYDAGLIIKTVYVLYRISKYTSYTKGKIIFLKGKEQTSNI